jgi:hypothetical protein
MSDLSNDKYLNILTADNFLMTIAPHKKYDHPSELL